MSWQFRPARDHGLDTPDRLRSLSRERGLGSLVLGSAWRGLLRLYLRLWHRLSVSGLEHLPPAPFVMVANHCSHLDALVLSAVLRGEEGPFLPPPPYAIAHTLLSVWAKG